MFKISQGVGEKARNFDGEITAIHLTAEELATPQATVHQHATLIDSQAAITAIADNSPTDYLGMSPSSYKTIGQRDYNGLQVM